MVVQTLKRIGKALLILLVVALLGTTIHDLSKLGVAQRELSEKTYDLTVWASNSVHGLPEEQGRALVMQEGADRGIVVYQYERKNNRVELWAESTVPGTVVIGTIVNLTRKMPFNAARTQPFRITSHHGAGAV